MVWRRMAQQILMASDVMKLRYIKGLNADQVSSRCLKMISYAEEFLQLFFFVIHAHVI